MRLIRDLPNTPGNFKGTTVALGNFDGVHLGHQAVIAETKRIAKSFSTPAAVLTFAPHPREFFSPVHKPLAIYPLRTKLTLLKAAGVEIVYLARFNAAFSQLPAEAFIQHVLVEQLGVQHVVTGENFVFGKGRGGNVELLKAKAAEHGFDTTQLPGRVEGGAAVSSSRIREHLSRGEVTMASALLGRPYAISGRVIKGDARGRTLGFPTANIAVSHIFRPRTGVYAVRGNGGLSGVANLGTRPTVDGKEPLLEAYWFDFQGDLYGKNMEIQLIEFIRPEQKFEGLESLKAQIAQDCTKAAEIL